MTEERILKDYWRKKLNNGSDHENDGNSIDNEPGMRFNQEENTYHEGYTGEDLGNFRDERSELILDIVEDHLNDEWFTCTINDDDLYCIVSTPKGKKNDLASDNG
ncbi:hypothetical protein Tco_0856365 [Tanacetum coccineum]|uniref:Uncharacterized protein n=1 Tax=Tanacetum coccineum TaxID=301880 RepID=A0ABQ5B494_9ASTR